MKFGEKVRDLRKKHSLTQDELAKCLGVSKRTVIGWERDGRYPRNAPHRIFQMHYKVLRKRKSLPLQVPLMSR